MRHCNIKCLRKRGVLLLWGMLLVCVGLSLPSAISAARAADSTPSAFSDKLIRGHWSEKPEIMRAEHGKVLLEGMRAAARDTARKDDNTIERCVTCHIRRDENQKPVSASDARHFCVQCHAKLSVFINCFTCQVYITSFSIHRSRWQNIIINS